MVVYECYNRKGNWCMSWHFWNLLKPVDDAVLCTCWQCYFQCHSQFVAQVRCEQTPHHSCHAAACLYSHQKRLWHNATAASLHLKYMKTASKTHDKSLSISFLSFLHALTCQHVCRIEMKTDRIHRHHANAMFDVVWRCPNSGLVAIFVLLTHHLGFSQ